MTLLPTLDLFFTIRVHGPVPDLPFLGPTVRGLLGYGLRQTCCGHEACADGACSLGDNCTYSYLFEGPLQYRTARRRLALDAFPQPFLPLVDPPATTTNGAATTPDAHRPSSSSQEVRFGLRLIGAACELSSAVIDAIVAREQCGFGARSTGYTVLNVDHGAKVQPNPWCCEHASKPADGLAYRPSKEAIIPANSLLQFRFKTPVSLDRRVRDTANLGAELVDAAARRLWLLEQAYGVGIPDRSIPRAIDGREFNTISTTLAPWEITRRSTRHGRVVRLNGTLGAATIEGPWHRHATLLSAMMHYGIGRNTTFGFGRLEIESRDQGAPIGSTRVSHANSIAQLAKGASHANQRGSIARSAGVPRWIRLRGSPPAKPNSGGSSTSGLPRASNGW